MPVDEPEGLNNVEFEVQITAGAAEFREAIDNLGVRERAALHRIHDRAVIDLRDHVVAPAERVSS